MTEDHHHHHQQQQQHPPPKPLKHDPISKPMALNPISFSNGGSGGASLKKHRHLPHQHQNNNNNNNNNNNLYRECLKNHAASLGGHALDGCGEFMPSPTFNPSVPTSLTCAACGCHRNFHRRLLPSPPHSPRRHHYLHHHYRDKPPDDSDDGDQAEAAAAAAGEEDDDEDDDDDDHSSSPPPPLPPSATPYYNSAPHMLMALRAGASGGRPADPHRPLPTAAPESSTLLPRKRFRTRFSPEQKERMHQLSERLGWRLQKKDDAVVDQCCREISIGKGVFKVWMHNNKHNFHKGHRASPAPAPGGGPNTTATGGVNGTVSDMNRDAGHRGNSNHALNGSSPPSSSS